MARFQWKDEELKETMLRRNGKAVVFKRWKRSRTYVTDDMVMVTDERGKLRALSRTVGGDGHMYSKVWLGGVPYDVSLARAAYSHHVAGFNPEHWVVPLNGNKTSRKLADWTSMPIREARHHLGLTKLPPAAQLLAMREAMSAAEIAEKYSVHRVSVHKALRRAVDSAGEAAKMVTYRERSEKRDITAEPDFAARVAEIMREQELERQELLTKGLGASLCSTTGRTWSGQ